MKKNTINDKIFFSVVLTTFNREHILQNAIDSVLNQTFRDWELIIVDDGSTDNTFENVVINYLDKDSRIKYIYQTNQKQAIAKNNGIRNSLGKYITFLDSDDLYLENHLFSRYNLLKKEVIELLHGGVKVIGEEYVPSIYDLNSKIHLSKCIIGGTFFIKKSVFDKVGLIDDISYGDDTSFFNKCLKNNLIIGKTNIKTYIYNRNSIDSICNNIVNNESK
jgi:glycosyltransferase involved in cell wall biosynthesis